MYHAVRWHDAARRAGGSEGQAVYRQRRLTGFELHVSWDFGVIDVNTSKTCISAYDINATLIARSTTEGRRQLIVCREIFALVQYRNKIQAEFQSRMDTIKERSRLWKALNRAKAKRLRKLDRRIDHMLHTLTKMMAELDRSRTHQRLTSGRSQRPAAYSTKG